MPDAGQRAPAVLAVAGPIRHRLDGRERFRAGAHLKGKISPVLYLVAILSVELNWAIAQINAWNRMAVGMRQPPSGQPLE